MGSGRKRGSSFLVVVALLACVALGYCFGVTTSTTPEQAKAEREKAAKLPPADKGEAASVKALRARIAELEKLLADARAKPPANEAEKVASQGAPRPPNGGGPREWLENIRKADPGRFAQMTNRFAQFRRRRLERQQRNLDFLASVDTTHMSAAAKKTHAALQDAIARREEIEEKMHDEGLSDAERRELFGQMRDADRELRGLRRAERDNLFEATANTLGFEGEDAKEIVDTLKEVVEATESSWRQMGPPPGNPPPPPGN